ncbi:glycosyltransferase, partial [Candidatus Saccharibacteria bacterium]|nr:glycosyltransferase [Candidatus Saccharibacteria bacterium]
MNTRHPLVSLIVPIYNVADFLPRCLSSISAQAYPALEIILVDDGSTDSSGRLCNEFKTEHKNLNVKLIRQTNRGLSAARNAGIQHASGEYVAFLDADDELIPDAITYLISLALKHSTPISICPHYEQRPNGARKNFNQQQYKTAVLSVEEALRRMLNEQGFMVSAWGKLYRRELFATVRFPEGKLHEDVSTTYRLFLAAYKKDKAAKITFGATAKYLYNLRDNSITNSGFDIKKLDLISQTDAMCGEIVRTFPRLKNTTNLRRLHARFSILRQTIKIKHKTKTELELENSTIAYILEHKTWILRNPEATKRDKLALASLCLGKTAFRLSWNFYERFF